MGIMVNPKLEQHNSQDTSYWHVVYVKLPNR